MSFRLLKKITNRIARFSSDIVKEYQYVLFQKKNNALQDSEDERFVQINQKYWDQKQSNQSEKILIEGFFAESGNNYLFRTGMAAKAIQAQTGLEPMVLFDKPSFKLGAAKRKYESFGIKQFYYIKPSFKQWILYFKAAIISLKYYLCAEGIEDIINLSYDQIRFGDLIYDDILKFRKNQKTIAFKESWILQRIIQAFYYYFTYKEIITSKNIKYVVVTHLVYIQYGMLTRVGLRFGADVISTNDLIVNVMSAKTMHSQMIGPTYHCVYREDIQYFLNKSQDKKGLIQQADDNLKKRFSGTIKHFDARLAYQHKVILTKEDFKKKLGIDSKDLRPFVIVFTHVFSDAPHSSSRILFRDYYDWLEVTINEIKHISDVNWLIKPHPSAKVYEEDGLVEEMIEKCESGNIFLYPKEASTSNLDKIVSAVVTVHGTAGIEFSCLGLPVILAGRPFYADLGFTYDPATRTEYINILKKIGSLPKLSSEQIDFAKQVYVGYMQSMMLESHIISMDALDAMWGYGQDGKIDISLGNKKINDCLEKYDPKHDNQYLKIIEYMSLR